MRAPRLSVFLAVLLIASPAVLEADDKKPALNAQQPGTASIAPTPTRPTMAALMSSAAVTAAPQRLRALNDALAVRIKGKLDADAAKAIAQFHQVQNTTRLCPKPQIDSVFPFSNFTPGGTVLIFGCGFGDEQQNRGAPPSSFVLTFSSGHVVTLTGVQWSSGGIAGTLPGVENSFLGAARTQPAILSVTTPRGSDRTSVTYRAPRVVVEYPFRQLIQNISQEANEDSCTVTPGTTFAWCYHARTRRHFDAMLRSQDTYTIDLKNGWLIDSWDFDPGAGCCVEGPWPRTDGKGQAHYTATFKWFLPCNVGCYLYYRLQPWVEGELGTSAW